MYREVLELSRVISHRLFKLFRYWSLLIHIGEVGETPCLNDLLGLSSLNYWSEQGFYMGARGNDEIIGKIRQ